MGNNNLWYFYGENENSIRVTFRVNSNQFKCEDIFDGVKEVSFVIANQYIRPIAQHLMDIAEIKELAKKEN